MAKKVKILKEIIKKENIYPVYQPILNLKEESIMGYEALTRITGNIDTKIEDLFSLSEEVGMCWAFEEMCRKKALKNATAKPQNTKLFLNVNPNVLIDKKFESGITSKFIKKYGLEPKDIVFEITERRPIPYRKLFKQVLIHYAEQGYSIAIDDFGSAYAGLDRLCYIKPDYLKLDIHLIRNIEKDEMKKALVKHLIQLCKEVSIKTIAEGIETESEAKIIKELEADFVQGYFYAMPSEVFTNSAA